MHAPVSTSYVPDVTDVVDVPERVQAKIASVPPASMRSRALVVRRALPLEPELGAAPQPPAVVAPTTRRGGPSIRVESRALSSNIAASSCAPQRSMRRSARAIRQPRGGGTTAQALRQRLANEDHCATPWHIRRQRCASHDERGGERDDRRRITSQLVRQRARSARPTAGDEVTARRSAGARRDRRGRRSARRFADRRRRERPRASERARTRAGVGVDAGRRGAARR